MGHGGRGWRGQHAGILTRCIFLFVPWKCRVCATITSMDVKKRIFAIPIGKDDNVQVKPGNRFEGARSWQWLRYAGGWTCGYSRTYAWLFFSTAVFTSGRGLDEINHHDTYNNNIPLFGSRYNYFPSSIAASIVHATRYHGQLLQIDSKRQGAPARCQRRKKSGLCATALAGSGASLRHLIYTSTSTTTTDSSASSSSPRHLTAAYTLPSARPSIPRIHTIHSVALAH